MKVLSALNVPNCFHIIPDNTTFYAFSFLKGSVYVYNYFKDNLISTWRINVSPNYHSNPIVDENNVYIPIQGGQLLALDKFSGETVFLSDLGSLEVVTKLFQDKEFIHCFSALPIRIKKELLLDNFSQLKIEKSSGRKIWQSNILSNFKAMEYPYYIAKDVLHSDTSSLPLVFFPDSLLVLKEHIACFNKAGTLQIVDKSLSGSIFIDNNPPFSYILGKEDTIYLISDNTLTTIVLPSFKKNNLSIPKLNSPVFWNGITGTLEGNIINLGQDSYHSFPLSDKINKLYPHDKTLIATTDNNIFLIGETN